MANLIPTSTPDSMPPLPPARPPRPRKPPFRRVVVFTGA